MCRVLYDNQRNGVCYMRLSGFLNELASRYGAGITFVDIDETIFHTFAMIKVMKDGVVINKLDNQEYNTYKLKPGESFDYGEFKDAELFNKTSTPIPQTIKRIKKMMSGIKKKESNSKIIFLTARQDFHDKKLFLDTFRKYGIPIDDIYVERAGNLKGTVAGVKKQVIMKYLSSGQYRRVRMIDDDMTNVKEFLKLEKELPQSIVDKVKQIHNITDDEKLPVIQFFGLLVKKDGSLKRIKS